MRISAWRSYVCSSDLLHEQQCQLVQQLWWILRLSSLHDENGDGCDHGCGCGYDYDYVCYDIVRVVDRGCRSYPWPSYLALPLLFRAHLCMNKIGRASCRERVLRYW